MVDDGTVPARGIFYAFAVLPDGLTLVAFSPELQDLLDWFATYAREAIETDILYRAPNGSSSWCAVESRPEHS